DASASLAVVVPSAVESENLESRPVVQLQHADHQVQRSVLAKHVSQIADADFFMLSRNSPSDRLVLGWEPRGGKQLGATLKAAGRGRGELPAGRLGRQPARCEVAIDLGNRRVEIAPIAYQHPLMQQHSLGTWIFRIDLE